MFDRRKTATRSLRKQQLHRLIVARSSINAADRMLSMLLDTPKTGYDFIGQPLYYAFFASIVISYARPFSDNKEIGALPGSWGKFPHEKLKQTHQQILDFRNKMVAHSDPIFHTIKIIPPGYPSPPYNQSSSFIGMQIEYDFAGKTLFVDIKHLCEYQLGRLNSEIDALLEELYGGMDLPNAPFPLRIDDGL